jgi:hypothetical protein
VESLLVLRVSGIEINYAESSISELGDSSAYKAVVIEGQGAIGYSLVPEKHVGKK